MADSDIYQSLSKMTEEMYLSLEKTQSADMQDQLVAYHALAEMKIGELISKISGLNGGEMLKTLQRKMQILKDDFSELRNDIGSKYKIYLRGCGNAGKSTLLNALLSIDETTGSRMGRIPLTFTIDTYTDEFAADDAEMKFTEENGEGKRYHLKRDQALQLEAAEEAAFKSSKEQCEAIIREMVKNIYLEQEREDIETDVYKQNLIKTRIREIKWGIGNNNFFHNCVLIDTPGLSQELRFTNVIEDVKNYEVDGIIWVISSDTLAKMEVIEAYQREFKELEQVYSGKKVIAVINMYGSTPDYSYGSRLWNRVEKRAREIYCGTYGFDELICVNAKMAYEGNLAQEQQKIDGSNISELRRKINEMFIEKSTEEYYNDKLAKIDLFLNNLYKEISGQVIELDNKISQYCDKKNRINQLKTICERDFSDSRDKIVSTHEAEIKNRIDRNLPRIKTLEKEPAWQQREFLEKTISDVSGLEKKIDHEAEKYDKLFFARFKELQTQSIISGFKTEKFILQNFQKYSNELSIRKNRKAISISFPSDAIDDLCNEITRLFGDGVISGVLTSILKFGRSFFSEPQEVKIYRKISNMISIWRNNISLSSELDEYENCCLNTLDKSMEITCGKYNEIYNLVEFMKTFIDCQPHMEWYHMGLLEILGGGKHV